MANNKTWWAPIWRGLVVDAEGKHYQRMKGALWLFIYLILHADRKTGGLKRKFKTTALEMGVPQKTIQRWLETLRDNGYIDTKNNGRCLQIVINRWKTLRSSAGVGNQNGKYWETRVDRDEESDGARDP